MKKTIIYFCLFTISVFANLTIEKSYGRKPAVLPVSGVSIDDVDPVQPEKATGYIFNEKAHSTKNTQGSRTIATTTSAGSEIIVGMILFLVLLPIGLWVSMKKAGDAAAFSKRLTDKNKAQEDHDHAKVVELRPKSKGDDENIKKAS